MTVTRKPARDLRLFGFRLILALACLVLIGQLWRLQMVQGDYYRDAADVNRFRMEAVPAPRGVIYDRRGHLLVRNQPHNAVAVIPAYLPTDPSDRHALLLRLADLLEMPMVGFAPQDPTVATTRGYQEMKVGILDILAEAELAPYRPARLREDVPREIFMTLEEEHLDWPGVVVQPEPVRDYMYGSLLAHLLGYVGPIPEEQAEAYEAKGYDPNRQEVGLTGVELLYEDLLRGQDGQKLVEVDVAGREIRTAGEPQQAVPGNNLRLSLDLGLQQAMEEALQRQLAVLHKKQAVAIALSVARKASEKAGKRGMFTRKTMG